MCFQEYWQKVVVMTEHWSSRRWLQPVIRMEICNFNPCPTQSLGSASALPVCDAAMKMFHTPSWWLSLSVWCVRDLPQKEELKSVSANIRKEVPILSCCAIPATHPAPGPGREGFHSPNGSKQTQLNIARVSAVTEWSRKHQNWKNSKCGTAQPAAQNKVTK